MRSRLTSPLGLLLVHSWIPLIASATVGDDLQLVRVLKGIGLEGERGSQSAWVLSRAVLWRAPFTSRRSERPGQGLVEEKRRPSKPVYSKGRQGGQELSAYRDVTRT